VRAYLCDVGVAGKETPVDVGAVAYVGVVGFSGGLLQDFLDETLGLIWLFEKELYYCCQDLELCLGSD